MNIRAYSVLDHQSVIGLWKECGLVASQNNPAKDIARKLLVDPDLFLVGVYNEQIVSTVMGGYEGHRGWINYLAVRPSAQRNGYGRLMMEVVEKLLLEKGCPKINLQVRSTNADVLKFYDAIGYGVEDVVSLGKRLVVD